MTDVIEITGLIIETPANGLVGVPGWATAPTLREALFTVGLVQGRYNISHQPTQRAMPGTYGELDEALGVCRQLCELLADERLWWDWIAITMPGALRDWKRDNPETFAKLRSIVESPASYVRELMETWEGPA
jgi:hypothetical protein